MSSHMTLADLKNRLHERIEYLADRIETLKKAPGCTDILQNTVTELKMANRRLEKLEERQPERGME